MRKEKLLGLALEDGKWREIRQWKSQGEVIKEAAVTLCAFLSIGFSIYCMMDSRFLCVYVRDKERLSCHVVNGLRPM